MRSRYLVVVIQEIKTPIIVEAENEQSIADEIIQQNGEAGDSYYSETLIISSVRKLED